MKSTLSVTRTLVFFLNFLLVSFGALARFFLLVMSVSFWNRSCGLERNGSERLFVAVHGVTGSGTGRRCGGAVAARWRAVGAGALGALDFGACPPQAWPELVRDDLDHVALLAGLRFVVTLLEATGDDDARTLAQRRSSVLAERVPGGDVEERDLLLPLTIDLVAAVDGQTKAGNTLAPGGEPQLGIAGEVAYDGDGVFGHSRLLAVRRGRSGRWLRQTAASCLGIGKTDELVADDVVSDAERALELVESASRSEELIHDVVAVLLLLDRVGVLPAAPPIGLAMNRAAGCGDGVGDRLHPRLRLGVFYVTIDDDHEFVSTHHACATSLRTRGAPGAPMWGRANMTWRV